jgi:hypothetical protein
VGVFSYIFSHVLELLGQQHQAFPPLKKRLYALTLTHTYTQGVVGAGVYFAGILFDSSDSSGFLGIGPDPDGKTQVIEKFTRPAMPIPEEEVDEPADHNATSDGSANTHPSSDTESATTPRMTEPVNVTITRLAATMGVVRNPAFTRVIRAIAPYRGSLYMGGNFLDPNKDNMHHVVAFDGNQVRVILTDIVHVHMYTWKYTHAYFHKLRYEQTDYPVAFALIRQEWPI